MSEKVAVGDWVRFYSNGVLVIAQVEYITDANYHAEVQTTSGPVRLDWILEVRRFYSNA